LRDQDEEKNNNYWFGLLTVIELAKNGFDVIATMRDLHKPDL
jgi:hypothetical protein